MKVLLPFLRTSYAFRSMQLAAASGEKPSSSSSSFIVETTLPTTMPTLPSTPPPPTTALARQLPPLAKGSRRVILVRHAETDWNARGLLQGGGFDVELNDAGHAQAQVLADELFETFGVAGGGGGIGGIGGIDVVVSSHLARAEETADAVHKKFLSSSSSASSTTVTTTPVRIISHKFGEMRFGDFEGLAIRGPDCTDETRQRFRDFSNIMHENKSIAWPGNGGESIQDVQERAQAGLDQILNHYSSSSSNGADGGGGGDHFCIVGHGRTNKILIMALLGLTGKDSVQQGNTGINVLDVDCHGTWKAHAINYLEHAKRGSKTNQKE